MHYTLLFSLLCSKFYVETRWQAIIFLLLNELIFKHSFPFLQQVEFEVADATKREYPPHSFDVVYSRDTILHINDKLSLFKRFFVSFYLIYTQSLVFSRFVVILYIIDYLCSTSYFKLLLGSELSPFKKQITDKLSPLSHYIVFFIQSTHYEDIFHFKTDLVGKFKTQILLFSD